MSLERFVSRHDLGWPATTAASSNTDKGMIAHYDGANGKVYESDHVTPKLHTACVAYWKRCRQMHMEGNNWRDVGYAYFVCPHDWILPGREVHHVQAAELPTPGKLQDGNTRYVAVTFATGPSERPNAASLNAWRRLRKYLREERGVKSAIHGHRDFTSTDCPGDIIYRMTNDGTLAGDSATVPASEGVDLVAGFPILQKGSNSYDVLTVRALLFERYLSGRYEDNSAGLYAWLRNKKFTCRTDNLPGDDLETDVRQYQNWEKLSVDGVVGPQTMARLLRIG